jgi:hypothetical protein
MWTHLRPEFRFIKDCHVRVSIDGVGVDERCKCLNKHFAGPY